MMRIQDQGPVRVGVLSDTHMRRAEADLFTLRQGLFSDVSLILHAGDIGSPAVLDAFYDVEVLAVAGNCDGPEIRAHHPVSRVISVGGVSIGLIHGWGERSGVRMRARNFFENVQAVVFGHTHVPECCEVEGVLMFNPGSFSDNRGGPWPGTVGILTLFPNGDISGDIFPVCSV